MSQDGKEACQARPEAGGSDPPKGLRRASFTRCRERAESLRMVRDRKSGGSGQSVELGRRRIVRQASLAAASAEDVAGREGGLPSEARGRRLGSAEGATPGKLHSLPRARRISQDGK